MDLYHNFRTDVALERIENETTLTKIDFLTGPITEQVVNVVHDVVNGSGGTAEIQSVSGPDDFEDFPVAVVTSPAPRSEIDALLGSIKSQAGEALESELREEVVSIVVEEIRASQSPPDMSTKLRNLGGFSPILYSKEVPVLRWMDVQGQPDPPGGNPPGGTPPNVPPGPGDRRPPVPRPPNEPRPPAPRPPNDDPIGPPGPEPPGTPPRADPPPRIPIDPPGGGSPPGGDDPPDKGDPPGEGDPPGSAPTLPPPAPTPPRRSPPDPRPVEAGIDTTTALIGGGVAAGALTLILQQTS